jgi:hypothetical protein
MCETTKVIERSPKTQREILETRMILEKLLRTLKERGGLCDAAAKRNA